MCDSVKTREDVDDFLKDMKGLLEALRSTSVHFQATVCLSSRMPTMKASTKSITNNTTKDLITSVLVLLEALSACRS